MKALQKRPGKINRVFEKIEIEELSPYGGAMSRLYPVLYENCLNTIYAD